MQEMEKPSPIRKFMEKTAKRKTFYISDVFAVFWLMFSSVSALFLFGFILNAIVCPFPAAP